MWLSRNFYLYSSYLSVVIGSSILVLVVLVVFILVVIGDKRFICTSKHTLNIRVKKSTAHYMALLYIISTIVYYYVAALGLFDFKIQSF